MPEPESDAAAQPAHEPAAAPTATAAATSAATAAAAAAAAAARAAIGDAVADAPAAPAAPAANGGSIKVGEGGRQVGGARRARRGSTAEESSRPRGGNSVITSLLCDCKTVDEVLDVTEVHKKSMNTINIATAVYTVSKLHRSRAHAPPPAAASAGAAPLAGAPGGADSSRGPLFEDDRFQALVAVAERRLRDFEPRALANLMWAFGNLSYKPENLVGATIQVAQSKLGEFNSIDLAELVWSLAALRHHPGDTLLRGIASVMSRQQLSTWKPQHLSNTLWAFATLGFNPGPALIANVCYQCDWKANDFRAQQTINLVWALATFSFSVSPLLEKLVQHLERRRHQITPESLVTLLWSCATLRCHPYHLMATVKAEIDVDTLAPSSVVSLLWAYATLGHQPVPNQMISKAVDVMESRVAELASQDTANLVWALAALGHHPGHLLDQTAAALESSLYSLAPQHLANLVWAYAKLDHFAGQLLEHAATAIRQRMSEFGSKDLSTVVWAYRKWSGQAGFAEEIVAAASARLSVEQQEMQMRAIQHAQEVAQQQMQSQWQAAHAQVQAQAQARLVQQQMAGMSLGNLSQVQAPAVAAAAAAAAAAAQQQMQQQMGVQYGLSPVGFPQESSFMMPGAVGGGVAMPMSFQMQPGYQSQSYQDQAGMQPIVQSPAVFATAGTMQPVPPPDLEVQPSPQQPKQQLAQRSQQQDQKEKQGQHSDVGSPPQTHRGSGEHEMPQLRRELIEGLGGLTLESQRQQQQQDDDTSDAVREGGQGEVVPGRARARSFSAPNVTTPPRSRASSYSSGASSTEARANFSPPEKLAPDNGSAVALRGAH